MSTKYHARCPAHTRQQREVRVTVVARQTRQTTSAVNTDAGGCPEAVSLRLSKQAPQGTENPCRRPMSGNSGSAQKSSKEEPMSDQIQFPQLLSRCPPVTPQLCLKGIQRLTPRGRGLHQGTPGVGTGGRIPKCEPLEADLGEGLGSGRQGRWVSGHCCSQEPGSSRRELQACKQLRA